MIWVDFVILAVIVISAVIAFFRGFLREAIGLAIWVVAFWIAFQFAQPAATLLTEWIGARWIRVAAAFAAIFIGVLIIGAVFNYLIGKLVSQTGFAGTDRALGTLFGVLRGVVVLVVLVLLAGLTPIPSDDWWNRSVFVPHLERGAIWVRGWLPPDLAREIRFDAAPTAAVEQQQG